MEKNKISDNVNNIKLSGIRKFYNKVSKVEGAISLTLGQPDFPVPIDTKKAMLDAINEDKTVYTSNQGIYELRGEISKFLKSQSINFDQNEICVTVGGSEGIMDVFLTFINKGDKVLISSPAYPAYESCVKLCGGEVINYDLKSDDFSINFDKLVKIIDKENPKIIVVSYPSNPTGAVLSKEARDSLYKILKEKDILIVTDEMYSSLCFEDEYYSIAQYEDIKDKMILVGGFSKMFSMTGLRIGYVCSSNKYIDSIIKVHQYNVSCAPSISQYGALKGLKSSMHDARLMKEEFIKRRNYSYKRLLDMKFEVAKPKGAFYIFPSIKKFGKSSEEFCEDLLKNGKVAIVPGNAFGKNGEGYARISYATGIDTLKEAFDRIEEYIKKLK
ncbi:MAG: aminotransferase class I/II-fold pyridoxal phosphate-dependent enzyme [Clostridium sp.]|nr:aminotransferase class I/II-fold pyridoxal phosphate-dependent enzyme [Clostridium sp.]